jgi:anti-sigma-K factor RskA
MESVLNVVLVVPAMTHQDFWGIHNFWQAAVVAVSARLEASLALVVLV